MATAAPTAGTGTGPSPAAGGEGEITRAPDTAQQHLPSPAKVRKGEAKSPIKPIKTKVELPGVDTGYNPKSPFDRKIAKALGREDEGDEGGVDTAGGKQFGEDNEGGKDTDAPVKAGPQRGPDGKFLKTAPAEGEDQGAQAQDAQDQDQEGQDQDLQAPEPPDGSDLPQTLEEAHESLKKVTQQYKSLQGMFGPLNARMTDLNHHQREAAKSATAWQRDSQAKDAVIADLKARMAQFEGGGTALARGSTQSGVESRQGSDPATLLKAINWNDYSVMEKQGGDVAALWLTENILRLSDEAHKRDLDALRSDFDAFSRPIKESQADRAARAQVAQTVLGSFNAVADIKNESGEPAFPELYDPAQAAEVGKLWMGLGMPPEYLNTPAGVVQAVLNYRFFRGGASTAPVGTGPQAAEGDEAGGEDNTSPDQTHLNSRAVRALASSRSAAPPAARGTATPGDSIKSALRGMREVDDTFGFPTRASARR